MHRTRHHVLAGAGFAADEQRGRGSRNTADPLEETEHGTAHTNHAFQMLAELPAGLHLLTSCSRLVEYAVNRVGSGCVRMGLAR